jgi:hypothetical protein
MEAQNGKRSIEYVVNIIDIKYLDGWDIGEYIEFITKQLKKEKFKTLIIGIGRMRIEW